MHQWRTQRENFKKIHTDKWKWKHNSPKPTGCSKSLSKREVYSNTILPQETRKISIKQPNLKQLEKEEQIKPTVGRRKERSHKGLRRNKWNRDKESNHKGQWN